MCLTPHDLSCKIIRMINHADRAEQFAGHVASAVRAEMARQRKTQAELAKALGITPGTAGRRLNSNPPFTVTEIARIADWLGIETSVLTRDAA